MANLLETIKQNRQALTQPAGVEDQTQKVQTLLRAKSGKAVGGGDAVTSNLGEQAAVQNTNVMMGQVAGQAQVQQQGDVLAQAQQQQQERLQRQDIDQAKKFDTVQNRLQTQTVLNDLSRNKGALDQDKQQAQLEQAAFLLSMQDKKYTDQLQEIGRRRRLDDEGAFKSEMQDQAFGDSLGLLQSKLGNQDVMSSSDRDFKQAMSSLNVDDALKIAEMNQASNERMAAIDANAIRQGAAISARQAAGTEQAQSLASLVSAGVKGYDAYDTGKFTPAAEKK